MQTNNKNIDFNCDLAQSFGVYKNKIEDKLLQYVSSVNISCGFHSGDPLAIRHALLEAKKYDISVGAHIGFDDIKGFGAKDMNLTNEELEAIVLYQVGAIASFAKAYGVEIEHVRPHGAMYRRASVDFDFSLTIAKAIKKVDKWLTYVGATSDVLENVSNEADIRIAHEVQLNMLYNEDGSVDYNSAPISNSDFAITRLNNILKTSEVRNKEGKLTPVICDTIHFSSSANNILEILQRANEIIKPVPINYNKVVSSGWV